MKVALEAGEVLDIALVDGERIIGTVSLQLKGLTGASRVGRPAGTSAKSASTGSESAGGGRRRKRKPMSEEARQRMAEAQRKRWEKVRSSEGGSNQ